MKTESWVIDGFGAAGLTRRGSELAEPQGRQVRVRVEAVALNYRDWLMLENGMGGPLAFPFVPGSDMCGTIEAFGPEARRFEIGDRVVSTFFPSWKTGSVPGTARAPLTAAPGGSLPGMLSRHIVIDEEWLAPAPQRLDSGEASTLPCAGVTTWSALAEKGRLRPGERVLIHGTGGVALFALAIAHLHGAETYITSANQEKRARAEALGADHALPREGWLEEVLARTDGEGVEHVVETVGGDNLGLSLQAVAAGGRISVIGVIGGFGLSGSVGPLLTKEVTLQGIAVGSHASLQALSRAVDRRGLRPVIDRRYGFGEARQAFDHLAAGAFGKIVIDIDAS